MKKLNFDSDKCMDCGLCELACSLTHSNGKDIVDCLCRFEKLPSRIEIRREGADCIEARYCHRCEYPACVEICIMGAIHNEDGCVSYDTDKCAACWSCIMACPFDSIKARDDGRATVRCDGCKDWSDPVCSAICPTGALYFEEAEKLSSKRRKAYGRNLSLKLGVNDII